MSAHVIAKAQPFSDDDDEKTTIESGWEDEASTTVEQGEVAEKIRALGLGVEAPTHKRGSTNVTSTNGSAMDEPTVDDQRANAIIAMIAPPTEPARLLITQGNDSGAELQVMPGKTYTIGRAIDNDVVLTDIAVSRKHFDLAFEGGAWVLIDRGSGNGTLVNGNLEDQPFMLANGDTIEIGNTIFRFDNANGVTREAASYLDAEEEEPSTVAGKPMGRIVLDTPVTQQPLVPPPAIITRPKTQPPPPLPLPRPRTQSGGPPPLFPQSNGLASSVMPAATLPLPQMAGRAPVATPQSPTLLGPDVMQPPQMLLPPQHPTPPHMQLQTTIPGGHSAPQSIPPMQGMPFGYPVLGMDRPSAPGHAQMLVIAAAHAQGRDAPTTAHVQPVPYHNHNAVVMPQSHSFATPQLTRKMKMVLGGAALALIAAVATVAIIKGASKSEVADDAELITPTTTTAKTTTAKTTTVEPIKDPKDTKAVVSIDDAAAKKKADDARKAADEQTKRDQDNRKKAADEQAKRDEDNRKKAADEQAKRVADQDARRKAAADEQAKRDEDNRKKAADDQAKRAADQEARRKAADDKKHSEDERRRLAAEESTRKADERKKAAAEDARKAEERRKANAAATASNDTPRTNKTSSPDVVARAKNDANVAYRGKNFQQAATILRSVVGSASDTDTTDLKSLARSYEQFGKAYNNGMSPGARSQEAFPSLRTAANFDAGIGGAYTEEIKQRLRDVAPAAAVFYFTHKSYKDALAALQTAESLGASNATTQAVRTKLESEANRLYTEANSEAQTNTSDAKDKLNRVKDMLESKSSTYQKASKLLASLP